jgi:hypothetical protein
MVEMNSDILTTVKNNDACDPTVESKILLTINKQQRTRSKLYFT